MKKYVVIMQQYDDVFADRIFDEEDRAEEYAKKHNDDIERDYHAWVDKADYGEED